jgi:ATP-binding cassette subfamily B protein
MTDTRSLLQELPLLRMLPPDAQELVRNSFTPGYYSFGTAIVREGEASGAYYVLVSGKARLVKHGTDGEEISLNVLRPGEGFGEMGLLGDATMAATVRASSDVEVLRLDKSVFDALVKTRPDIRHYFELQIKHRHLQGFLREFTPFASLPPDTVQALIDSLQPIDFGPGETVFREGDAPGPLFIVEDGRLRMYTNSNGRTKNVAFLRKGDFFGEVSVVADTPRAESVETVSPTKLLALLPETYRELLDAHPEFAAQIEQRLPAYASRHTALFPLDFAQEMLPAEIAVHEKVGMDQVQYTTEMSTAEAEAYLANIRKGTAAAAQDTPFAEDGRFIKSKKRIRTFRHVRQVDEMDCGAASLAMVCQHFGRAVSLARIRQLVHTSLDGTSLKAICSAATDLGLAARSVKSSEKYLGSMPLPAIVHWEGNHWVVLYDVTDTHVRIADPGTGRRRMSRADFHKAWSGYAALFDYTTDFERAPEAKSSTAWLRPFVRQHARLGLQAAALALIVSALQMVLPIFTQLIVDRVLVENDPGLLRVLVIGMLGVLVFMMIGCSCSGTSSRSSPCVWTPRRSTS